MFDNDEQEPDTAETDVETVEESATTGEKSTVRLATRIGQVFVVPAYEDLPEISVTPDGVELTAADADRVTQAARSSGVTLIEKES